MTFQPFWHRQAHSLYVFSVKCAALLLSACLIFSGVRVKGFEKAELLMRSSAEPALGVSEVFGRWPSAVKLVYDPDGAPGQYADTGHMLALIQEAAQIWERVCGVRIELTGADALAREDETGNSRDGLVRVHWQDMGAFAGRAGADHGLYDDALGYYPFEDGEIILSNQEAVWSGDRILVNTLVHEMGHLLGLGHSDNPNSVMYANPYNFLAYPREDDIQAIQALYGPDASGLTPQESAGLWRFVPPRQASAAQTRFLFKPNQYDPDPALLTLSGVTLAAIDSGSPDDSYLRLHSGGIGNFANPAALDIKAVIVLIDPGGNEHTRRPWHLQCQIGYACGKGFENLVSARVLKSIPGQWQLYVLDESRGESQAQTLLHLPVPVNTTVIRNLPPQVELGVNADNGPTGMVVSLQVVDPEGDDVDVIWHIPEQQDPAGGFLRSESVTSGEALNRAVRFPQTGRYTLFVELRDHQNRYAPGITGSGNPGGGFQTLLRLTVDLPLVSAESVHLQSSTGYGAQRVLTNTFGTRSEAAVLALVTPVSTARDAATLPDSNDSSARFWMQAAVLGDNPGLSSLRAGDQVQISGSVSPQIQDTGQAAELFVVIRSVDSSGEHWSFRDEFGNYQRWNGALADLSAAERVSAIGVNQAVDIFRGKLQAASHRVFLGYRLLDGESFVYTSDPLRLNVMAD